MSRNITITFILASCLLIGSCCKNPIDINGGIDFERITERNQLPYTLPTDNNIADASQTKEIFFYNENSIDIVFRSIGVNDANSSNTKLWVQIINPDIKVFADVQIDSFYIDTLFIGGQPILEVHNRDIGTNFFEMDTALLALPFTYNQLDDYRPRLFDQTVATVHVKFNERLNSDSIRYDVERGVLKRKNHEYVGFKNTVNGDVFFIELENRYTLKSIEVRKD